MEIRGSHNFLKRPTFQGSGLALKDRVVSNNSWDQNGFVDRTSSTISFKNSTRRFQIAATGSTFDYYIAGIKYSASGAAITLPATEGAHYVYFTDGTLASIANPNASQTENAIMNTALISVVYWSTTNGAAIYVGEERHGKNMSPATHLYLHTNYGMQFISGLGLNTLSVDGNGSIAAHAQFGIDAGEVRDEDIEIYPAAVLNTDGLPVYHMLGSGASPNWVLTAASGYAIKRFGDAVGDRLAYNQFTGGSWQLTEVVSGKYILAHVFATTEKDNPMIAFVGQNTYSNIAAARTGAETEIKSLVIDDILFPEIHPIATIIFQTNASYNNPVNAITRSTGDGDYIDWRSETISRTVVSSSDHNSLTGLQGGQAAEYYHLTQAQHTDIELLPYASGNLDTRVTTNTSDISTIQASSGKWYRRDQDLIPSNNIYDLGSIGTRFQNIFIASGNFTNGITTPIIQTHVETQSATSGTYTVDWTKGHLTRITLDGNITFTFSNPHDGQKHIIQIKQDATGAHTATWPATVRWPAGTAPTLTATSGGIDYIDFMYDDTDGKYDGLANSLDLQ